MSNRTPEDQTADRHITRRIVTAVLGLTAAALIAGCDPATGGSVDPDPTVVGEDGAVEFSTMCDDTGFAYDIEPNTPEARAAARRSCRRMHGAIHNAPWPEGWHPAGDAEVER